ncbi:MAG: hypothetical protein RSA54_13980, partial [Glutamicibacter sp.]
MKTDPLNTLLPFQGLRSAEVAQPLHNGQRRPMVARELSASQIKRDDVFMFFSPKEDRRVSVLGPLQLALRLQLEFDPVVAAATERPRSIPVGTEQVELHFWWQYVGGSEFYALVVPNAQTVPGTDGQRRPRQLDRLQAAARDASIALKLITEDQLKRPEGRTELCYQLLGICQSARDLGSALILRNEVAAVVNRSGRITANELFGE